ncbi:PLP-dependent transferase [Eremomyces bilateralis CBS 781.70]|uniref:aromatic-amino-acid transaminase n=1 Tax=Eremomyces bilateralis CBS 781.70 TaxID=1392243 RepID=A0A6G1G0L9_9PEZI|nr:PLP-dependent transferase [Eremomyces bilateralis CBS 781.70]KAF1811359.1 PLP-dependent transferase [Eremomyces bilateralis CBS 781.70]
MAPPPSAISMEGLDDTTAAPFPNPLTLPLEVNDIFGRRNKADKKQWGVAAPSVTSSFKIGSPRTDRPKAKRWDDHFTDETLLRKGSSLKQAAKHLSKPGIISLGGGLPSSEYFPFATLTSLVPTPPHFAESDTTPSTGTELRSGKHDLATERSIFDLSTALNYGQGSGAAQLLRWIVEHTQLVHDPPYRDWACTMSIGSTSALDMTLRMFTTKGEKILSEDYTFASAVQTAEPMGVGVVGVKMDAEGLLPGHMAEILGGWDAVKMGAPRPRVLYTVPTGQNPTGATMGKQRRQDVYAVARQYDVIILEDEPYYFLQMQPYVAKTAGAESQEPPPPRTHREFLDALVPSFLSMDVDGRVIRMDSFSKVIAPGSRVGWITASDQIVERYRKHADVSTQGPSGFSQIILFKLLEEHWGHSGYLDWLLFIRMEYTSRREVILDASEKFLPKEVVSWVAPSAGMFFWMKMDWRKHPQAGTQSLLELEDEIYNTSIEEGSLVMKGSWFYADPSAKHDTLFFRATYAAAPSDKIQEAIRRFGVAVKKSFGLVANGV